MIATSEWDNVLVEARRVAADIAGLLGVEVDAATILTGRAAIMNLARPGRISAGGATRLLRTVDGWCAVALPRDDDVAALPALMEVDAVTGDPGRCCPVGPQHVRAPTSSTVPSCSTSRSQRWAKPQRRHRPCDAAAPAWGRGGADGLLVADLSSLWAGPLCGQLLALAGAVVVKVESPSRPDGTRRGEPAFFDWMNAGKLSYCVDFDSERDALRRLLDAADIVIEGSRLQRCDDVD